MAGVPARLSGPNVGGLVKRPALTARVVRGLRHIEGLVDINMMNGREGSDWCEALERHGTLEDAEMAHSYLIKLLEWYDQRKDPDR